MECYRCGGTDLALTPLTRKERADYYYAGLVLRTCPNCGLVQNHVGDDEPLSPAVAAQEAPEINPNRRN